MNSIAKLSAACLLALTACATASHPVAKSDAGPCGELEAKDCVLLLDQQKVTGTPRLEALIAAGNMRLTDGAPEYAIPFYNAVIDINPADPGGHLFRAKALAALADKFHRSGGLIDQALAKGHYSMAGEEYAKAIKLAPDKAESYGPAVDAFLKSDKANHCGLAKALRAQGETQFGQTEAQIAMAELIKRECGVL
jgi:tetratricopeptide (TPR) repeat protein